ncbi:hypothetical protein DDI_2841 [Dickeya dianthicola RNS04.9]|nr:hypothetical protein DDI_2841 [Dickeya dianthicola RNS04.9]
MLRYPVGCDLPADSRVVRYAQADNSPACAIFTRRENDAHYG